MRAFRIQIVLCFGYIAATRKAHSRGWKALLRARTFGDIFSLPSDFCRFPFRYSKYTIAEKERPLHSPERRELRCLVFLCVGILLHSLGSLIYFVWVFCLDFEVI